MTIVSWEFESPPLHLFLICCGNSSVGRAQPCQGWGREFESRFPLSGRSNGGMVDTKDLKSFGQKCPCEFESRFEHTIVILLSRHVTSVTRRLFVYRAKWVGRGAHVARNLPAARSWSRGLRLRRCAHLACNLPPIFVNLYNKPGILYMQ